MNVLILVQGSGYESNVSSRCQKYNTHHCRLYISKSQKNFQVFVSFHWFPLVSQFPETENPETGKPGRLLLNMKFVCNKY